MRAQASLACLMLAACGAEPIGSSATNQTEAASISTDVGTTADAPTTDAPTDGSGDASATADAPTSAPASTGEPATTDATTSEPTTGDPTGEPTPGAFCEPVPACDAPPPTLPGQEPESSGYSRGRDMFYVDGEPQWVLGKFTKWGFPADKDIVGGTVHVFLDRDCAGEWVELGTTVTTDDGDHPIVEGVEDSGGRVYFEIPADQALALGRHRVYMIEDSEWESAELLIDVVPAGAPFFISDVDGTLTTSENEEAWDFLNDTLPDANPFAAEALSLLASKGYRPGYITARPEWLDRRTREFLATRGFPRGIMHTTLIYEGAMGDSAALYKSGEFAQLRQKGLVPAWVFGNKDSDALAFDNAMIDPPDHRVFFQYTDATYGGRRIDSYEELLAEFELLPDLCDP
ncbi:MAG: phosphatidylinositol transfer protein [Myxococcales bacterium]|nr:phosphatidylinositol transfer protein [Myxococcales bacterium]